MNWSGDAMDLALLDRLRECMGHLRFLRISHQLGDSTKLGAVPVKT